MARKPRCHLPEAFYHVIARGNHQQVIFHDEGYYLHYLSLLEKNANKHSVTIHAYALMTNHVHLLVQVGEQPLGEFMQGVQQGYTQYVNTRNQQSGHLFQGRYQAYIVENDEYLLTLVRYIHLNPVTAGLVNNPIDHRWSSHRHYFNGDGEGKVETSFIKAMMESSGTEIGDYKLLSRDRKRPKNPSALDSLMDNVARFTGLTPAEIRRSSKDRETSEARQLFVYLAGEQGYSLSDMAECLGRARSSLSEAIRSVKADVELGGAWVERLREYQEFVRARIRTDGV